MLPCSAETQAHGEMPQRRSRARATSCPSVATVVAILRPKRKNADSPPTVQAGATTDDLAAKAPRKLSPASPPLSSPETDMEELALPTTTAAFGGDLAAAADFEADALLCCETMVDYSACFRDFESDSPPAVLSSTAPVKVEADLEEELELPTATAAAGDVQGAATGDFEAEALLCSETIADGAGCRDFESGNGAFAHRRALKTRHVSHIEATAAPASSAEKTTAEEEVVRPAGRQWRQFPDPMLPNKDDLRRQRMDSFRHRLTQCRAQQARGDFAPGINEAVRTLPRDWREKIVEWLQMIVIGRPALHSSTVAAGVSLLDAYMSKCAPEEAPANADDYELCAVSAFVLACKYIERANVTSQIRRNFKQGRFTAADFARQEAKLLAVLDYRASPVTVNDVSRLLIDEFAHVANGGARPDPANPGEQNCARQVTRLEGITNVLLDLQLSSFSMLGLPRAAVASGTVAAACEICNIDFEGLSAPIMREMFEPFELQWHDHVRDECQRHFCETFPDLVQRTHTIPSRAPSPQSVVEVGGRPPYVLTAAAPSANSSSTSS